MDQLDTRLPPPPPLQLKGELMDLEFSLDTDHRKRRRNRTTQSCLNCHTAKRKCDRKRPCHRCVQLGLTGLCVYEIDDLSNRDDPNVDEPTRLRKRIAELESLVRELRGKPHPRWAEAAAMREHGDPGERWHSRAKLPQDDKTPDTDHPRNNGLYRLSPSPPRLPPHSLSRPSYSNGFQSSGALSPTLTAYDQYSPQTEVPPSTRSGYGFGGGSPGGDVYWRNDVRDHSSPEDDLFCTCLGAHTYAALNHQLRGTINNLRQQPHTPTSGCRLYKRIVELNELLEDCIAENPKSAPTSFGLPTPETRDHLPPPTSAMSVASTPYNSPQEWTSPNPPPQVSNYNPYFPMHPTDVYASNLR